MPGTLLLPSATLSRGPGRIPHTRHGWCAACDLYTPQPARGFIPCLQCGGSFAATLDSGNERDRHAMLTQAQARGEITDLVVHPRYPLEVNGWDVGTFTPDFSYAERGRPIVEEVKSTYTVKDPYYQMRKRVFQACYEIHVVETIL